MTKSKDRVLVVRCKAILAPKDFLADKEAMERQLESGVVVLPNYYEFCCLAAADEIYIMHDDCFPCDPDKADGCKKTYCYRNGGDCRMTSRKEWSRI